MRVRSETSFSTLRLGGAAAIAMLVSALVLPRVHAYPEFQRYVVQQSGRAVNCAMCHANSDGPEGTAPGQIGRLTPAELEQLGRARAALEPGANADSPILNAFGDHLVNLLGKKKILELRLVPEQLAAALPADSDLDYDGIPDAREYQEGTHPLLHADGNPWRLFQHNVRHSLPQLVLTFAATALGLYGLHHLLVGIAVATRLRSAHEENEPDQEHPR